MQNIDIYAAELGQMIATNMVRNDEKEKEKQSKNIRQAENHVTKSLGVLQENGLYAFFLYQKVEYKSGGEIVLKYCHDL
ncbi:MAG: hypothetical protein GYA22_09895, partial [Bacteroidales bacterium]|nr:hypothetical protein [Bacteroidales bacterium]